MPFDPNKHEGNSFDLIEDGEYMAIIEGAELKDNSKGTGAFLSFTLQIVDKKANGRKLWVNLNLDHPNSTAVAIAENELADICRAVGVGHLDDWVGYQAQNPGCLVYDPAPLANKPLTIVVGREKRKDTGEIQNRIKGYKASGSFKAERHEGAAHKEENADDLPF